MNDTKDLTWLDVWTSNYTNKSTIASDIMSKAKSTYKGDPYIPWAPLLRALYVLDPNADVDKVMNDKGGYVFTDTLRLETVVPNKDGTMSTTITTVVSHFVKVAVTFMGKVFTEVYPIQDQDYSASKVYDQNKVNKALQRNMARTISLATGIGWSLYEATEKGQFDDDTKPTATKPVIPEPVVSNMATNDLGDNAPHTMLAKLINQTKDNPKTIAQLDVYNKIIATQYTYNGEPMTLSVTDDLDTLIEKAKLLKSPAKLYTGLSKIIGESVGDNNG